MVWMIAHDSCIEGNLISLHLDYISYHVKNSYIGYPYQKPPCFFLFSMLTSDGWIIWWHNHCFNPIKPLFFITPHFFQWLNPMFLAEKKPRCLLLKNFRFGSWNPNFLTPRPPSWRAPACWHRWGSCGLAQVKVGKKWEVYPLVN